MERARILIPLPLSNMRPDGEIRSKSYRKLQSEGFRPLVATIDMRPSELKQLYKSVDGILFPGGNDIYPPLYGEKPHPATDLSNPEQDIFELELARRATDDDIPVLAICRGAQMISVAKGGSLLQEIKDKTDEQHGVSIHIEGASSFHDVEVSPGTKAHTIFETSRMRNVISRHHQAVEDPGSLKVSGKSPQGIIEILEDSSHPFLVGIQPHLDLLYARDQGYLYSARLYNHFKEAVLFHAEKQNRRERYAS